MLSSTAAPQEGASQLGPGPGALQGWWKNRDGGKTPRGDGTSCMASPGSLERNGTAKPSEMLLPGMWWDLTSLSHIPPLPGILFPLFFFFSPLIFFHFSFVLIPGFESVWVFSLFKLPST